MRRNLLRNTAVAAVGVSVAAGFSGCELPGQSELDKASKEAIQTMNEAVPSMLATCAITSVSEGPRMLHQGNESAPSLLVDYTVRYTPEVENDPWLRAGGTEVDGVHVEVFWLGDLIVRYTLEDGTVLPGLVEFGTGNTSVGEHQARIPVNTQYTGERVVEPKIYISDMFTAGEKRELDADSAVSCGTFEIDVEGNDIKIVEQ